jgi:polysaccharide pyruvyl transferase WcaK-like protein
VPRLDVHRFRDDGREHVHAAQTRDLISQWVRRTGEPVVLVPEVWHKTKLFDIPADAPKMMVLDRLPDDVRPHVRLMPEYWMPDEAQAVYECARLVVSAEMHSVILGLAAGVPSVHPHFSQAGLKQWMLRDLGIEEWLFDQDVVPVERIADAIVAVREHPERARRMVDRAAQAVRRRQDETMAVVREAALGHTARRPAHPPRTPRAAPPARAPGQR